MVLEEGGGVYVTVVLRDLVSGRLVGVEVVLAVEAAAGLDGAAEGEGGAQGWEQRGALEVRLGAWEGGVEEGDVRVGGGGGRGRGGA